MPPNTSYKIGLIDTFWEVLVVLAEALVGFGDDAVADDLEDGAANVVPLVVVLAAGTGVDVLELLGCPGGLLLVGGVAVPVVFEDSYSAVEVVVTEMLLDLVLTVVMELTKVESLELELLGRNCDFELLPTSPWPRGSSPASTSASSSPSPPCSCCAPCTWPGWARRELSALLGGFLVLVGRRTWQDGKLRLEL